MRSSGALIAVFDRCEGDNYRENIAARAQTHLKPIQLIVAQVEHRVATVKRAFKFLMRTRD